MTYGCHNLKKQKHPEQLFSLILEYLFVILKHTIWKKNIWVEHGYMIGLRTKTAQKMKFSIKDFFSKYDQIRRKCFYVR